MQRFNVDADRIDVQYCCPSTMHFSLFSHIALMPDETDAKLPLGELEETSATPCTTWMKTIQQDLKSNDLSLNEAIDMAQNRPLWRLMSTFGTTHS